MEVGKGVESLQLLRELRTCFPSILPLFIKAMANRARSFTLENMKPSGHAATLSANGLITVGFAFAEPWSLRERVGHSHGRAEGSAVHPQRCEESVAHLIGIRPAAHLLDQKPGHVVAWIRVGKDLPGSV